MEGSMATVQCSAVQCSADHVFNFSRVHGVHVYALTRPQGLCKPLWKYRVWGVMPNRTLFKGNKCHGCKVNGLVHSHWQSMLKFNLGHILLWMWLMLAWWLTVYVKPMFDTSEKSKRTQATLKPAGRNSTQFRNSNWGDRSRIRTRIQT